MGQKKTSLANEKQPNIFQDESILQHNFYCFLYDKEKWQKYEPSYLISFMALSLLTYTYDNIKE